MTPGDAAEIGAGRTVQAHRNNRRTATRGGEGRTVVDFHQAPGNGDPALRKDQHRPTCFQQSHHPFHGQGAGRVHGEKVDEV